MTLRAILVDDSDEFLASAGRLLESQGMDIVGYAKSGDEAVKLAATLAPHLALVDIELGEEDGIALTRALHEAAPATRVVLISAYERDELEDVVSESLAAGYVHKSALGADTIAAVLGTA